jgi:tetratricopeptide (TPR) repeat protein
LSLQPGHFWARFFLGVCHLKTGQWEAAKEGLGACLNQHPDFVWGYLFRSFANEKLRALPEAEADFQKALRLNPSEDARYVLFLTRGILHFNQQEWERAAHDFRSVMILRPKQYNAYLNLAQVDLAQGMFDEAEDLVRQAMSMDPPAQVLVGYHVERGRNLLRAHKLKEAEAACAEALLLDPRQPAAYEVRARALLALARFQEAERAYDYYLANGGEPTPDIFRGRGLARMKLGKYPDAAEDYTRALERARDDGDLYEHRGWALFFCEAWKLALRDFSTALDLDAEAGDAYTGRGLARVMLGNYQEAIADADDALRRKPGTPEMMHNIACIFAQASARATTDGGAENRESLAASYRGRALETIQRTLQMLPPEERAPFWRDKILPDPALAPLRGDARFQKQSW